MLTHLTRKTWSPALVMLLCTNFATADEIEELRGKAEAMQREARALIEAGHVDEAEPLARQADRMIAAAEQRAWRREIRPDGPPPEIAELHQRLQELHREQAETLRREGEGDLVAELRQEMERVERRLREGIQRHRRPPHLGPGSRADTEAPRRLEHLHAAIEHLHQAGLHEIAERVNEHVHAAERELHERERQTRRPGPPAAPLRAIQEQMERLYEMVDRLQGDVRQLQTRLEEGARHPHGRRHQDEDQDDDRDDDEDERTRVREAEQDDD